MTTTIQAYKSPRERELRGHDTRRLRLPMHNDFSPKLCECGCGQPAPIAKKTRPERGQVAGVTALRFVNHHNRRISTHTEGAKAKIGAASRGERNAAWKDGRTGTTEYNIWRGISQRCTNQNTPAFKWYGARGISVCDRWLTFENFLADMGLRPEGKSIDRIDNDGNYEPGNCRWATPVEQRANRRDSRNHSA